MPSPCSTLLAPRSSTCATRPMAASSWHRTCLTLKLSVSTGSSCILCCFNRWKMLQQWHGTPGQLPSWQAKENTWPWENCWRPWCRTKALSLEATGWRSAWRELVTARGGWSNFAAGQTTRKNWLLPSFWRPLGTKNCSKKQRLPSMTLPGGFREIASSSCLQSTQLCMPIARHAVLWGTRTIRTPLKHTYHLRTQRRTQRQLQLHNHLHLVHLQHRAWVAVPQQMGESDAYDYMELPGVPRGTPLRAMPDETCEEGGAPYEVWPTSGCYLSAIIRFCWMIGNTSYLYNSIPIWGCNKPDKTQRMNILTTYIISN